MKKCTLYLSAVAIGNKLRHRCVSAFKSLND
jgi:hypothetical protein